MLSLITIINYWPIDILSGCEYHYYDNNMTSKKEIRACIRQRKKAFTAEELLEKSRAVMNKVCTHPKILAAHTVMMYASLPDEVNSIETLEWLRHVEKQVLLPIVVSDTEIRLKIYNGPASLCEGSFHILEPTSDWYDESEPIDVAIVPGMAFDHNRYRLGRGKGYYDRFLGRIHTYKIGVCFDFQYLKQIPYDIHDIMMDEVIFDSK